MKLNNIKVETIEWFDDVHHYHYDVSNDVLYLRLDYHRDVPIYAEEDKDGSLLLRQDNDDLVGIVVINWWKNFGEGNLPDSLIEIQRCMEPWIERLKRKI
ncbi:hypothetical protein LCGC14_1659560 [marine sediment metagenome]|uniref:DUF2283 domain-containing protein n=1 Tax=marine sediment metagenome TaxID=412755 RepID=A0A0F9HUI6_9ZZZZ